MRRHTVDAEVLGPWSLITSRAFWEGFSPAALDAQRAGDGIRTVFRVEADWSRAEVEVTQRDNLATISQAMTKAIATRYKRAGKAGKGMILDER